MGCDALVVVVRRGSLCATRREVNRGKDDESCRRARARQAADDRANSHSDPGYGEVLVKIVATGVVTPICTPRRATGPSNQRPQFVPGHEGAGVVAAIGPGVTDLKQG